jgi:hypothetical protein
MPEVIAKVEFAEIERNAEMGVVWTMTTPEECDFDVWSWNMLVLVNVLIRARHGTHRYSSFEPTLKDGRAIGVRWLLRWW